jgi:glycosyltransferase involved in cell wall biosynthesis
MVIEAMPSVVARYPAASFVFVTHNPEQRADLQRMAGERGMEANVHFLGMISEEEKLALLRASDVLPFPSRYEGFGLPVVEAMAAGTPALVSDIPVMQEIAEDAAVRLPPDDDDAWADALEKVATDPGYRAGVVARGTLRARDFSWEKTSGIVRTVLEAAAKIQAE